MAVFTIAGLTLKEAIRRKTLFGSLILGLLVLGLSLLLILIHYRMEQAVASGHRTEMWMALQYPIARSAITTLCLSSIKSLGAVLAALLAGGAISSEIERGLLAVILPKPIPRWQILFGKWLGLNVILIGSSYLWTVMVWASFTLQTHLDLTPILKAGLYLTLYPILICTLSLTLSTVAPRLLGTVLALALATFAWFDGIFNSLGTAFDVQALHTLANVAGLVVPQAYIGYWIESAIQDITIQGAFGRGLGQSPRLLTEFGASHFHVPRLDALYISAYIIALLITGMFLFQRRDIS